MSTIREPVQDVGPPAPAAYQADRARTEIEGAAKPPRPVNQFSTILGGSKKRASVGASVRQDDPPDQSAGLLALSLRGFRPEVPRDPSETGKVRLSMRLAPQQRVLVGSGDSNGHARIQIGGGHLAGSEIRLALVGTHIDVQLLTRNEGSRQTLVAAMDAVRERLRARGVQLRTASSESPSDDRRRNPQWHQHESRPDARQKV